MRFALSFLAFARVIFAWTIPNIDLPTFTYQCMPMELVWRDGSPPYTIWFKYANEPTMVAPNPKLGAWYNLTGGSYLVPCKAPAGSTISLVLKDSTGWISTSLGSFLVLPSSDSSCLTSSDNSGLAQSQSTLSTILESFRQSVVSAISVSATAKAVVTTAVHYASSSISLVAPVVSATESVSSERKGVNLGRIIGPVLGCLVGILIGITLSVCYVRRKRRHSNSDPHIPLASTSAFDLLAGEQERHPSPRTQATRTTPMDRSALLDTGITATTAPISANRGRLQLHDGSFGQLTNEKSQPNTASCEPSPISSPLTPVTHGVHGNDSPRPQPLTRSQNLEQRTEELSAPELERLAALVARRLERVRGAPPQYQAADNMGS